MDTFIKEYHNAFSNQLCDTLIQILENNIASGDAHAGLLGNDKSNIAKKEQIVTGKQYLKIFHLTSIQLDRLHNSSYSSHKKSYQ